MSAPDEPTENDRLSQLSVDDDRTITVSRAYTSFVRSLRFVLPAIALVMTVIVLTWDEAGRRMEPVKKEDLIPQSADIQNELLKPVFNSIDDKKQPYRVTADRASQGKGDPDIVQLDRPVADLKMNDGGTLDAVAAQGLYEQNAQKLNLEGDVEIRHSNGTVLKTHELRVDMVTQKAFSGKDVHVENPSGTIDATGLEGDVGSGTLVFTGPAKVILYNQNKQTGAGEPAPEQSESP